MAIAYSYIRFSSTEQLKGDSLRRQTDLSRNYAEANGLDLDTKLNLRDLGISAFDKSNLNKGALGQFLKLVEDGMIPRGSYLLVESLDRLSRDKVMDALGIFLNILNAGIIIVTLADNQVYSREKTNDNWASLIMSIVIMSRANEESATKSRRIRASWDNKRQNITKKRFTARCPYWLKPSEGDTGFDLIPERVDVVKRIFQMSIDGIGTATIVKRLNGENVPLFSPKSDGWQTSYIQKVLSNRAVYGELQLNLQRDGVLSAYDVIHDYYPAIMSKEDWLLAASIREGRRSRGGVAKGEGLSNLFSGLLKCGYCGGPMNMSANMKKKANGEVRRTRYVACSKGRRGAGCHFIQWNYDDLEGLILQFCQSVDFGNVVDGNQNLNQDIELARKRLTSLDDAIKNKQVSLNNLLSALEAGSNADIPATLLKRISSLEIEIEDLLAEQQAAEKDVIKLNHEQLHSSNQRAATIDLIYLLQTLEGDALRDLRVKLSEAIRRSISHVKLYAGGIWNTEDEIQEVAMSGSLEDGVTLEEALKEVKSHVNTKPNKQARFMTMYFYNGECRTVARENN
ncbi:MAG TPA: recombinase family protein [Methylotenera sp.]